MDHQKRIDKLAPGYTSRKRIKLRTVAHFAKQSLGLIRWDTKKRDRSARRTQQAGHEVHQRRLPCSIRPNETRNAGRDLQVDSIHSEYLAIKLGDVVEDD